MKSLVAFSTLELLLSVVLLGVLVGFYIPSFAPSLHQARLHTTLALHYTKHLAMNDSLMFDSLHQTRTITTLHRSIDPNKLLDSAKNMWQIQFHQSGIYTRSSFSVYVDTPRFSVNTNRDNQPAPGDIIATSGKNRRCLSGYSNINTAIECRNNGDILSRLGESFGIEAISISGDSACQETGTFRIAFDHLGMPYCTKQARPLRETLRIHLHKQGKVATICVAQNGYISRC